MRDIAKHSAWNLAKYHKIRQEVITLLGGECVDCGSKAKLEFDHNDPQTKTFTISALLTYSWKRIEPEITKCVLRCKECHLQKSKRNKELRGGQNRLPENSYRHGTARMYHYRACRCSQCKTAASLYKRKELKVDEIVSADQSDSGVRSRRVTAHGTRSGYRNCGTPKCAECRAAQSRYMKEWRARKV